MLADLRIDAEVHPIAGLDFVWAAAHVYRDTLGLAGKDDLRPAAREKNDDAITSTEAAGVSSQSWSAAPVSVRPGR